MIRNIVFNKADIEFLQNERVKKMSVIDWGKTVSIINEHIQLSILNHTWDNCKLNETGTGVGYDIILESGIRIQSKLRQVSGATPYSKSVHFSTTRRHSKKNMNNNKTGHICYNCDEFDFVFITLVHKGKRDIQDWYYSYIPVWELLDPDGSGNLVTSISSKILFKYKVTNCLDKGLLPQRCQELQSLVEDTLET